MTNPTNIKGNLLSLLAAVMLSGACVDGNTHQYPTAVRDNFVKGCRSNATSPVLAEACICSFDKIQQKYTLNEFKAIEKKMEAGERPPEFMAFAEKSLKECLPANF